MEAWILEEIRRRARRTAVAWMVVAPLALYVVWRFRDAGWWALGALAFVLLVVGVIIYYSWKTIERPEESDLASRLSKWGDLRVISDSIEREFKNPTVRMGEGWQLGNRYFIRNGFFGMRIHRVDDLIWAYRKVVRHSINFIPTHRTYHVVLKFAETEEDIQCDKNVVDEVLHQIARSAPWVVLGFTDKLERIFSRSKADFVRAVGEAKKAFANDRR